MVSRTKEHSRSATLDGPWPVNRFRNAGPLIGALGYERGSALCSPFLIALQRSNAGWFRAFVRGGGKSREANEPPPALVFSITPRWTTNCVTSRLFLRPRAPPSATFVTAPPAPRRRGIKGKKIPRSLRLQWSALATGEPRREASTSARPAYLLAPGVILLNDLSRWSRKEKYRQPSKLVVV